MFLEQETIYGGADILLFENQLIGPKQAAERRARSCIGVVTSPPSELMCVCQFLHVAVPGRV